MLGNQFKNECFIEMYSGSKEGSYFRLMNLVLLNSRLYSNREEGEEC